MRFRKTFSLGVALLALAGAESVRAESPEIDELSQLRQRLDAYESELKAMRAEAAQREGVQAIQFSETSFSADAAAADAAAADPKPTIKKLPAGGRPTVVVKGRILTDIAYFGQDDENIAAVGDIQDGMDFRQARIGVEGVAYDIYSYNIEMDFAASGRPSFTDVYMQVHELPIVQNIRVGRFKEPFSLEELTSTRFITFMERAIPNDAWVPSRTVGGAILGWSEDQDFTYALGIFRTRTDEYGDSVADDGDRSVTGRLTHLCYYDEPSNGRCLWEIGGSYRYSRTDNDTVTFDSRPEIRMAESFSSGTNSSVPNFVSTGAIASEEFQLLGLETAWVNGPLSIQAEWQYNNTSRIGATDVNFNGGYIFVSYFLTGEHRNFRRDRSSFDRVTPFENFFRVRTADGVCCGHGAWELAARYSYLDLEDDDLAVATSGVMDDYTLGLNWYLTPYCRMMWNYIHVELDRQSGPGGTCDVFGMRFQVDF